LLDDRIELVLEVGLQVLLELRDLVLRVLLGALQLLLLPLDRALELAAGLVVHHRAAGLQLLLIGLQLLAELVELVELLLLERLRLRRRGLAFRRFGGDALDVDDGHLRAFQEGPRRLLGGRGRRLLLAGRRLLGSRGRRRRRECQTTEQTEERQFHAPYPFRRSQERTPKYTVT